MALIRILFWGWGRGISGQTVLNAFHKKRADPRVKSVLAHERANFICRSFCTKFQTK